MAPKWPSPNQESSELAVAGPEQAGSRAPGVMLTGTRGAGKTTMARLLTSARGLAYVQPVGVTTRKRRSDDAGEYEYIDDPTFAELRRCHCLFVEGRYGEASYGVTYVGIERIRRAGKLPVLTVTPVAGLAGLNTTEWLVVWLDATDEVLNDRLAAEGRLDEAELKRRCRDRAVAARYPHFIDTSGQIEESFSALLGLIGLPGARG